jgi:DNA-binding beta-propeller fold protein YncE
VTRLLLLSLIATVVGLGQTLESTIYLPDSFGGIRTPTALALDIPGNRVFVAGTRDDRILIVDGRTNQRVGFIPIWAGYCPTICYNPASHKLYTRSGDGGWFCIADADSARVVLEFDAGGELAENARRFYCDSADNKVYCLTEDGTPVGVIDGRTDSVYATQFTEQPTRGSRYDTTTRRWTEYHCSTVVVDSAIARAAGLLVYPMPCFNPRTGRTYEIERQQLDKLVVTEGDSVIARVLLNFNSEGCYSPRHDRLYVPDGDLLAVVELAEQRVVNLLSVGGHLTAVCYSPVHNRIYLADDSGSAVLVFDPDSNRVVGRIKLDTRPVSLFYNAALDRLWCRDADSRRLVTIDCRVECVLADVDVGFAGWAWEGLCLDSLGRKLYCASMEDSMLSVVDAERGSLISRLKLPGAPGSVCFDSQNRKLYCALWWEPARLAVIDARTDTLVRTILLGDEEIDCPHELCYSPLTNRVYCAGWEKTPVVDCVTDSIVLTTSLGMLPRSVLFSPRTGRIYASDVASVGIHVLRAYDESADSLWEVAGVDRPNQILWDQVGRLFVSGPSRIYVLREE